jgi:hypothetical protein
MNEYKYDGTTDNEHRSVPGTEIIKLVSQSKGLTARTINDLLAASTDVKVGKMLRRDTLAGTMLAGLTAGRPPKVITLMDKKPEAEYVTDMMTMGYCMWYLRRLGLLTGQIDLSLTSKALSTVVAINPTPIFGDTTAVMPVRLMFWKEALDKAVHIAQTAGEVPVVICNSMSQLKSMYNQLSDQALKLGAIAVLVRLQQNAKWLSGYLCTPTGIIRLNDIQPDNLVDILGTTKLMHEDQNAWNAVMDDYLLSKRLADVHQQYLPAKSGVRG